MSLSTGLAINKGRRERALRPDIGSPSPSVRAQRPIDCFAILQRQHDEGFRRRSAARARNRRGHRVWTRCATAKLWRLGFRGFRRALGAPAQELMQGKGDFIGVRGAPGNDALELDGVLSDGADFHQLSFDDLRVSHRTSSMAHGGIVGTLVGALIIHCRKLFSALHGSASPLCPSWASGRDQMIPAAINGRIPNPTNTGTYE